MVQVLGLDSYPELMNLLPVRKRKEMAMKILQAITNRETLVDSLEDVRKLLTFIGPLIHDVEGYVEEQQEEEVGICVLLSEAGMLFRFTPRKHTDCGFYALIVTYILLLVDALSLLQ